MAMTFGMHLGHVGGPMADMRKLWRFADANGFDWFSSADHFQESPYRDGNGPCFEAISTMTAIALDTKHVRVGSLVICVNYRNPGVLAKAICTIDHLSGGRCEIGIGAGWHQHEYEGYGIPFERIGIRQDHLEEAVQILRMLFDQPVSNFKGQYFQLNDARCNPKPIQKRLPIWVGGLGEKRTLRTAAVAPYNIRVNAVAPGFIDTEMTMELSQQLKEKFVNMIPLQRFGTADEVAKVVLFLLSDESQYITGQTLQIDGGLGI